MARILLPTIEEPGFKGGIARYIEAIKTTFPGNVEVVEFASLPKYEEMLKLFWRRRQDYDQVWVHHVLPLGTTAMMARMLGGKPYVVFLHGLDFDLARQGFIREMLTRLIPRLAKKVVTNSVALAEEVRVFVPGVEVMTVYPCVNDEMINAAQTMESMDAKSSIDDVGLRLLTVARLVERKGHLLVLEVIKEMPGVSYDIVGEGAFKGEIEARIQELGLGERVKIWSGVDNARLVEFYNEADVFVMPAIKSMKDREGFGIVYLEAGLFGLPVIANRTPGVDEAVVDGVTGLLIDGSVDQLQAAIAKLVNDVGLRQELGRQGRDRVLAEFTRLAQTAKLDGLL